MTQKGASLADAESISKVFCTKSLSHHWTHRGCV